MTEEQTEEDVGYTVMSVGTQKQYRKLREILVESVIDFTWVARPPYVTAISADGGQVYSFKMVRPDRPLSSDALLELGRVGNWNRLIESYHKRW